MADKVTVQILTTDALNGETVTTNLSNINPALGDGSTQSAEKVDTCARALVGLSNNTYLDALIITTNTYSVTEQLAE